MRREDVREVGQGVLDLLRLYRGSQVHKNERAVDPVLLAYLRGAGYSATRQYNVRMPHAVKPHRIDFRVRGNPRSVIELAVRRPSGRNELSATQNLKELKKLARVGQKAAHMRYLLLLDLSSRRGPIARATMKADYDSKNAGPGRFRRNPVRVVYVHEKDQYDFLWKP